MGLRCSRCCGLIVFVLPTGAYNIEQPKLPGCRILTEEHVLNDAHHPIKSLAWSSDMRLLASASLDSMVRIYDMTAGDDDPHLAHTLTDSNGWMNSVAFSKDDVWLAAGSAESPLSSQEERGGCVRIYSMKDGPVPTLVHVLTDAEDYVNAVAFSSDGHWLASGSHDSNVRLYNVQDFMTPQLTDTMLDTTAVIKTLTFSGDSFWLLAGAADNRVRCYILKSGEKAKLAHTLSDATEFITSMSFSTDDRWLATGSRDGKVRLYRMQGDTMPYLAQTLTAQGEVWGINGVSFSSDGKWLVTASSDEVVRLYAIGNTVPSMEYHPDEEMGGCSIWAMVVSPDCRWIATGTIGAVTKLLFIGKEEYEEPESGKTDAKESLMVVQALPLSDTVVAIGALFAASVSVLLCLLLRIARGPGVWIRLPVTALAGKRHIGDSASYALFSVAT